MTLRCRLLGHELVPTKFVPDGGVIQRTLLAQCHRCGFTVKFETEEGSER